MAGYKNTTFKNLSQKRKTRVREEIYRGWQNGLTSVEIAKKVRISVRSVSTAFGNLTRQSIM